MSFRKKSQKNGERQTFCRSSFSSKKGLLRCFKVHPLFLLVGVWYCFKGELFLFLISCLVAVQHECAHAFAAAKLGYTLNNIVLMPFGAVIDGELENISLKDEIFVAVCGPLANLFTAAFFVAVWWFEPTVYAFTDVAYYSSIGIALINLLPAYPLDGGRILRCALVRVFLKSNPNRTLAERKSETICLTLTFVFAAVLLTIFIYMHANGNGNVSLLLFSLFLFFGGLGNRKKDAVYCKMDFSVKNAMLRGMEIRRIAISQKCALKDVFRFFGRGEYVVLEIYDDTEQKICELSQNELSTVFLTSSTPYQPLREILLKNGKNTPK